MACKHILGLALGLLVGSSSATAQVRKMDLVISTQNAQTCGHNYARAAAWIGIVQRGHRTGVALWIRGAKPNHLHTVWLKLAAPSPLSGAGATPAAPVSGIPKIIESADSASAAGANAFYTNRRGNALVWIALDFRLKNYIYPFSVYQSALPDVAIGNAPFTFRVISHCTDNMQHGLKPGPHEPTFQVSLR